MSAFVNSNYLILKLRNVHFFKNKLDSATENIYTGWTKNYRNSYKYDSFSPKIFKREKIN